MTLRLPDTCSPSCDSTARLWAWTSSASSGGRPKVGMNCRFAALTALQPVVRKERAIWDHRWEMRLSFEFYVIRFIGF